MTWPASIVVALNPLKPSERETYLADAGTKFIDWLVEHYPDGFGRPIQIVRNGQVVPIDDSDFVLAADDVVAVLVGPGVPAITTAVLAKMIIEAVIIAAVTAAFTLALNAIFKPGRPKSRDQGAPDPIYSVSGSQNAARVGEPIPALYGRMITTPDYAAQPYTFFHDNDQYLDQVLVLGWGEFDLNDVRVGETPVSALESDAVEYWLFDPADHGSAQGPIETLTGVMENVVSSPEVADQELNGQAQGDAVEVTEHVTFGAPSSINFVDYGPPAGYGFVQVSGSERNNGNWTIAATPLGSITVAETTIRNEAPSGGVLATLRYYTGAADLTVGPFITCPPGKIGNRIFCDFVFPQGLYSTDTSTGDLLRITVDFEIQYQQVADDGTPIGGWTNVAQSITDNTNTPRRITIAIDVPPARYRVRVYRVTGASSSRSVTTFVWTGLKFRLVPVTTPIYGAVSLLVTRIRGTNGIAAQASTRISAEVTRRLPRLGSGPLVATTSPADAFIDIYTNPLYGGRRPLAEVDLAELARLETHWGGQAHFNAGFAQRSTIWEALKMATQVAACSPLPLGQLMSIIQDGVKAIRTQLFSDANMIKGSLSIGYNFDRPGDYDGVRVEYRDPQTWNSAFVVWPAGALDADLVELFGCTDPAQALGFAKLLWNKRLLQRKTAHFETDLEGLIPRLGDRVAVASELPRWARAGQLVREHGLVLTLDSVVDWDGTGQFVILRQETGEPSDPIAITPGPDPNQVILTTLPPFPLFGTGDQEPTHYAIGTSIAKVADFTIANVEHQGGSRVGIDAIVYNPQAFAGTLPWLEVPV